MFSLWFIGSLLLLYIGGRSYDEWKELFSSVEE